ncbi:uncharacterized protein TRAVEDRAFT_129231, partial [Trametes versicolor FP-101664 SS1]|uniref:uncharacterized protein n=1 Tax=Trametes versicolor (strain FP-101664) TaxID=717944 RepID=UPI0004624640
MVRAARKYGVGLSVHEASEGLKTALPAWAHPALVSNRLQTNSPSAKCLRERHGVLTVGDCLRVARRLYPQPGPLAALHSSGARCRCDDCCEDREAHGCANPPRCATLADAMLRQISPKWRPGPISPKTDGPAAATRGAPGAAGLTGGSTPFGLPRATALPLSNALRVFTCGHDDPPAPPSVAELGAPPPPLRTSLEWTHAFTDGSCVTTAGGTAAAGSGVWFGLDDARNTAARVPGAEQTNNAAELHAVALAAEIAPAGAPLAIKSD